MQIQTLIKNKQFRLWTGVACLFLVICAYFYFFQFRAPSNFPVAVEISVSRDENLSQIAASLKEQHVIQSPFWFINFVIMMGHEKSVVGGNYNFTSKMSVFKIAQILSKGNFGAAQIKTTIPEGSTIFDVADILGKKYPKFDSTTFITIAKSKEGYLFPDTYFFGSDVKPENVLEIMTNNFNEKFSSTTITDQVTKFGKSFSDVLKMASILEGEARQMRTRQIIAGILWKRLKLGMPLQVDAAFRYVNGKTSAELTMSDLKINSPYNTYVNTGLPPTPISSPGLDSVWAAMTPINTTYLYFLTDKNGNMHYAETLEDHLVNVAKYLGH